MPLHEQFPPLLGYHPVLAGVLILVLLIGAALVWAARKLTTPYRGE